VDFLDLFGGLVLGSAGLMLVQIGRRRAEPRKLVLGLLLFGLPWLLGGGGWAWALGALLFALAFWP
jgi:hypothetical protein